MLLLERQEVTYLFSWEGDTFVREERRSFGAC